MVICRAGGVEVVELEVVPSLSSNQPEERERAHAHSLQDPRSPQIDQRQGKRSTRLKCGINLNTEPDFQFTSLSVTDKRMHVEVKTSIVC